MGNDHKLNFISSIILALLSTAILLGSVSIYLKAAEPLHTSPALMPGMLGIILLLCSLLLLRQSIQGEGAKVRAGEAKAWFQNLIKQPDTRNSVIGILLMAVYTFGLLHWFQFWVASLIFTIAMLLFLRATRWWMVLIISGSLVGAIVLLFSVVFRVPLP